MGVLDFCMLIIILLINWLLNFIDGKLIWISITEFRKALTNDTVTVTQWNCTRRKWYTYIIRTFTWSKGLDPDNLPAVDHQIKWDTKHGAWSDDPRLETWHLYRSCYCYDDKFNIYPFIMRWKWKIIFVKYKNEE